MTDYVIMLADDDDSLRPVFRQDARSQNLDLLSARMGELNQLEREWYLMKDGEVVPDYMCIAFRKILGLLRAIHIQ